MLPAVTFGDRLMRLAGESRPVQIVLAVAVGIVCGAALLIDLPLTWKAGFVLVLASAALLLVVGNTKRVLLCTLVFVSAFYRGKEVYSQSGHHGVISNIEFYLADAMVFGLLLLLLIRLASRRSRIRLFAGITLPALVWLGATAMSLGVAADAGVGALQVIAMGKMFVLYWVVANSIESEQDTRWVLAGILLAIGFQGALGIYQGVTKHTLGLSLLGEGTEVLVQRLAGETRLHRSAGTICHPNSYAMYLSAAMSFALALLLSRIRILYRAWAAVVLCVGALGLVFSLSRGGWMGFAVAIALSMGLALRGRRLEARTAMLILAVGLASLLVVSVSTDVLRTRLTSQDRGAAASRIVLAKGAVAMFRDYPLLGVGVNNYTLAMPQYDPVSMRAWHGTVIVHTLLLLLAAETGVIGVGAFLWFAASVLIRAWQSAERASDETMWIAATGAFSALIVLMLHSLVDYALLGCPPLFMQLWLVAALTASVGQLTGRSNPCGGSMLSNPATVGTESGG
jgi:putative inorganic carbon (HCO3(-)) transporter